MHVKTLMRWIGSRHDMSGIHVLKLAFRQSPYAPKTLARSRTCASATDAGAVAAQGRAHIGGDLRLLDRESIEALTTNQIASLAGVSIGTVYQ